MAKIIVEIECDGHKCGKCGRRLYSESIIGTNWDPRKRNDKHHKYRG